MMLKIRKKNKWQAIKKTFSSFKNHAYGFFYGNNITFKHLFIIENVILLIIIGTIVVYEYYLLDRSTTNLTTQNKLTATSMLINLLMTIF